jgi:hypothetical protein
MYIIILLIFKSFILKEINKYIVNSYEKKNTNLYHLHIFWREKK